MSAHLKNPTDNSANMEPVDCDHQLAQIDSSSPIKDDPLVASLQAQLEELRAMVTELRPTEETGRRETMEASDRSPLPAAGNKMKEAILASIRLTPLTDTELDFRRRSPALPAFNGDPTQWFYFYTTFQVTTEQCRFSARENMVRVSKALREPVRSQVKVYFDMPHRLPDLMALLKRNYGSPAAVLEKVTEMARNVEELRDDMTNVPAFHAVVMRITDALDMLDEPSEYPLVTHYLVQKLGLHFGMQWFRFLAQREATRALFMDYIEDLFRKYWALVVPRLRDRT